MFNYNKMIGYRFYNLINNYKKSNIKYRWHVKREYRKYKKLLILNSRRPKSVFEINIMK